MLTDTFAMIKSKAVRDRMHHVLIPIVLDNGFIVSHMEMRPLSDEELTGLYGDHLLKPYWPVLRGSVEGDVILMGLRAVGAVTKWRTLMGPTDPAKAPLGTLRHWARKEKNMADNLVHGSDSDASARRELQLMFGWVW